MLTDAHLSERIGIIRYRFEYAVNTPYAVGGSLTQVDLFDGPLQKQHLRQVKLELLPERGPGWFAAVHSNDALRAIGNHINKLTRQIEK